MLSTDKVIMYSNMIKNGARDFENAKMEFKREWWNLGDIYGMNEFLKDLTAMANTPGDNGYIIVGLDKTGNFFDAPLPDDSAKLRGYIFKRIQEPIDVNSICLRSKMEKELQ